MKLWRGLSILVTLAFALSGTGQVNALEKQTLKLGAVFSIRGKAGGLGKPEQNTVLMLAEQVNAAGGINGFPLEVIIRDDETLKNGAIGWVQRLIEEDKVLAIIGPSTSGNSMAVKSIAEKARVPLVSCAAAEAIVSPPEQSRYTFKTPQRDSHVAIRILEEIFRQGITKIAIISETSPFGEQGRKQITKYAAQMGIKVVADETFGTRASDMTPQLKKAQSVGAGAVVNWSVVPTQTVVGKNMKEMGWKVPLFHSHGLGNPKFIRIAGDSAEGIIFPAGRLLAVTALPDTNFQKKMLMDYKRAYEQKYGPVSTFGGHAYDAFWLVVNAMKVKKVNPSIGLSEARDRIRDGIEQTREWIGTAGVFNMSRTDHCGLDKDQSLEMLVIRSGKMVPLPVASK